MHTLDPNPSPYQIEANERRFVRVTVIFTIKDAYDLSEWYLTDVYKQRYYWQFGFNKNAPKEKAWERVTERIRAWAGSPEFQRFCAVVGAEVGDARALVADLLALKGDREHIRQLLEEYKEELALYAKRGRTPKQKAS